MRSCCTTTSASSRSCAAWAPSSRSAIRRWRGGSCSSRTSARIRTSSACSRRSRFSRRACISRIDDDVPEISETLLNIVYPHYVRPIPAMSIVEMRARPGAGQADDGIPAAARARCCTRVPSTACRASSRAATTSRCGRSTSPRCSGRRPTVCARRRGWATPSARAAHRAALPARCHVREARARNRCASISTARAISPSALYELLNTSGATSSCARCRLVGTARCVGKDDHAAGVGAAAGGTRAQRGDAAVSRPLVRGVPADPGVLRLSREVSVPRSRAASIRSRPRDWAARSRF